MTNKVQFFEAPIIVIYQQLLTRLALISITIISLSACSASKSDPATDTTNTPPTEGSVSDDPMVIAASNFLAGLSPTLKTQATFPFTDKDREEWDFVPLDNRQGARIGHMSEIEQRLAFDLLKTGLSEKGYEIAREIMDLEKVLIIKEKQQPGSDYRNPTKYYLSIFGTPSDTMPWSWTYEGHHLSLNYSSVSGKLSVTPSFLGANPAEVDIEHEDKGKRVLGFREDQGRTFMLALNAKQQEKALISKEAYPEIVTGTESEAQLAQSEGLSYKDMTTKQQSDLAALIKLHINIMKPDIAEEKWKKMKEEGLENFFFAWAGGLERNQKNYYRIHGPTTIIEYDNAQNNGNHAHIVWRDTENDFGRDLLKIHHLEHEH